ncbi:hypothetical protein, partial [Vallitalea sp.]|uniref:hypothetical protein n=1 Tax=Vallitalea sp. TaxID=1882829 RepID=UPI0025DE29C5
MIYVASLSGFGKKTFEDKTLQTKMDKIIEQLHLSPKITGMDTIVLGPKDLSVTQTRNAFISALKEKHEDILIIYLYTNDKQAKYLGNESIIGKKLDRKINLRNFKEAVTELLENKTLIKKEDITKVKKKKTEEPEENPKKKKLSKKEIKEPKIELETPKEEPTPSDESIQEPEDDVIKEPVEVIKLHKVKTLEERIKECTSFSDWNLFKKLLDKDTIVRDLMTENNQFAETISMLRNVEQEIVTIFKNENKNSEQKFEEIRELGIKRSGYKTSWNNMIAEKVMSILATMTTSAESIIHSRLREITSALDKFSSNTKLYYKEDKEKLNELIKERLDLQFQLHELSKSLITVYQSMDETVNDIMKSFDNELPSENKYINEIYKTSKNIFTPINAPQLATKLMSDLQKNRISLSALEKNIQEVIAKVFQLCELDETIILHQNKLIKLLEANNVEDVVIVDTILKNALRLYIGPYEVGTRATAITWAGILSRRHNSLLVDISGSDKFRSYGIEPISLENLLNNRIQEQFLCVEGDLLSTSVKIENVIAELKTRLNYYSYINIILEASQTSLIKTLAEHALSVTYITDCTTRGNTLLKNAIDTIT